jgi:hypothetical protein
MSCLLRKKDHIFNAEKTPGSIPGESQAFLYKKITQSLSPVNPALMLMLMQKQILRM